MRETVSFAIIGAGVMGHTHASAISALPGTRIVVVCAPSREKGESLAAKVSADWTADYRTAVRRNDVDIVTVCTPSGFHMEPAVYAAQHGKHLIIEKPLEITLGRVDAMIRACRENAVKLACIFPYRFQEGTAQVKRALIEKRLGRVATVGCFVNWYRSQDYYTNSWHGTLNLDGGGALINQAIHNIDLLQYLLGPARLIMAATGTLAHEMQGEDVGAAILRFENGVLGCLQATTGSYPGEPARIELRGDRGTIFLQEGRVTKWDVQDISSGEAEPMPSPESHPASGAASAQHYDTFEMHRRQIADFIDAVANDREPIVNGEEARKAVEIIELFTDLQNP